MIKLLLAQEDVDPNLQENNGKTLLSKAAAIRQIKAVKLLLKHPNINVDLLDNQGRTP
jgi:ankyrin repeat protein